MESRRDDILAAITAHLREHGVLNVTLRGLARDLDVAPNTLEHYFGSKSAMFAEALLALRAEDQATLVAAVDASHRRDAPRALLSFWDALTSPGSEAANLAFLETWIYALRRREDYAEFLLHVVEDWVECATHILTQSGVSEDRRVGLATLAIGSIRGLLLDALSSGEQGVPRIAAALRELGGVLQEAMEQGSAEA